MTTASVEVEAGPVVIVRQICCVKQDIYGCDFLSWGRRKLQNAANYFIILSPYIYTAAE